MAIENKFARIMRNTGPARFFIPLGIILVVFGVIMMRFKTENFEQTTGRITEVVEITVDPEDVTYDVSFTYTVNGKEYKNSFVGLAGDYKAGDSITVYYDPADPNRISNTKSNGFLGIIFLAAGILAAAGGFLMSVKAFKKSGEVDRQTNAGTAVDFGGFKQRPGVREYYVRYDDHTFRPGYIIEDKDYKVLFEGEMTKNAVVGPRMFEFRNHVTGKTTVHEVGHVSTTRYSNDFFSEKSWFKIDGKNVWDILHEKGFRIDTNLHSKFPHVIYNVTRGGETFAVLETSSKYVHEEDEAQHKVAIPVGWLYYRVWTASDDLDSLFLAIFAVSETDQAVVE